jgi:Fe-S-cluster containining protein
MKPKILHTIYQVFADWSTGFTPVCRRGCSPCCTQNVTITALEGVEILRFVVAEKLAPWLADQLKRPRAHQPAKMTTNAFALACLEGKDADPGAPPPNLSPCPFLENALCRIYPVRPLNCRIFASTKRCSAGQPAVVPDHYFEAATAVTQLVEHLGQREYWGNLLDVLPALLDISEFRDIADRVDQTLIIEARLRTLTANPLPGFLLSEEGHGKVSLLLDAIFAATVAGKSIEDILNGK